MVTCGDSGETTDTGDSLNSEYKSAAMLEEYQTRFLKNVRKVIGQNYLRRRPNLRILDMGCEPNGLQLHEMSKLTRGQVVGINIPEDFPTPDAVTTAGPRVQMFRMDGMKLDFADHSFDMVVSANVIEHVPDPTRFISEAARVLKPNGVCYIETAPIWTSARGHHIMEGMVANDCPDEENFRDDGTVIPDWAHINLSREQLAEILRQKLRPETCEYILWFIYESGDLNKTPWSRIRDAFHSSFQHAQVMTAPLNNIDTALMPTDQQEDYLVYGFQSVCRHRAADPISRRLYWRLREWGL